MFKKEKKKKIELILGKDKTILIVLDKINFITFSDREKAGMIHYNGGAVSSTFNYQDINEAVKFWENLLLENLT